MRVPESGVSYILSLLSIQMLDDPCRGSEARDMMPKEMTSPSGSPTSDVCVACGGPLERIDEYRLDIAGLDIPFYADRCTVCRNEYVNAPEILRPDSDMIAQFRPDASELGTFEKLFVLSSRDQDFRAKPGGKVAATLLWYLMDKGLADAVFLAHQSVGDDAVMVYSKKDLTDAGEIRLGRSRSIVTTGALRANLLSLSQLRQFAEEDKGAHPRIAVMGRPCQVYTMQKLLWDRLLPGYRLAFALGTFCYGNFAPGAWGGQRLREMLGFDPSEVRQVEYIGEEVRFSPRQGNSVKVAQESVAGLVNANCLQCYDFTARFGDLSVGHVGRDDLFEAVLARTPKGAEVLEGAIRDGFLAPSSTLYGKVDEEQEQKKTLEYLRAMVGIKRELTGSLR